MIPKVKIPGHVKKWAPIAGVELTGGYASNWAYDKKTQSETKKHNRVENKGRQPRKRYSTWL